MPQFMEQNHDQSAILIQKSKQVRSIQDISRTSTYAFYFDAPYSAGLR